MDDRGFYRRPLPEGLIPFSSSEGRAVFREALLEGGMEGHFSLAEQLHTQAEPAFCGLGTLVVVLNALAIDPGRLWKGPWRWFGEELLDCCRPLDAVKREGVTMDQFACLARCNGARVRAHQAEESTIAELRYHVRAACSSPGGVHVVVAYSRAALGQTGDGHYSPVGGYHRGRDLALVMDVARFKYPPHWAPLQLLWDAMQPADPVTQRPRGYFVVSRADAAGPLWCCAPEDPQAWARIEEAVAAALRDSVSRGERSLEAVVGALVARLPDDACPSLAGDGGVECGGGARRNGECSSGAEGMLDSDRDAARRRDMEEVLEEVRRSPLFALVRGASEARAMRPEGEEGARCSGVKACSAELATILILSLPHDLLSIASEEVAARLEAMRQPETLSPRLRAEVSRVRAQIDALDGFCRGRL